MERKDNVCPQIHFYNAEHTESSFDDIWQRAKDYDYIFMELVTNARFKDYLQDLINYGASSPDWDLKKQAATQLRSMVDKRLLVELGTKIIETGKEIYFIDVNEGEEGQVGADEAFKHMRICLQLRRVGSYDSSLAYYTSFVRLLAKSSLEREKAVTEEVQAMLDSNYEELQGKKVIIIQGAIHTRVYHEIKRENPEMAVTRSFRLPDYFFPTTHHLARKLMFGKEVLPGEYKRSYLATIFFTDKLMDMHGSRLSDQEIFRKSAEIAGKIPSKELDLYWEQLKAGDMDAEKIIRKYY